MGNCIRCVNHTYSIPPSSGKSIKESIDTECPSKIKASLGSLQDINLEFYTRESFSLNALGYALYKGKAKAFKYIWSKLGASIEMMEASLNLQKISGISLICENGYTSLLEITLPFYASARPRMTEESPSIDLRRSTLCPIKGYATFTPVHLACEFGHIGILRTINKYFKKTLPPYELDLHAVDETSGENCALIACRNGNLDMIKFLHKECRMNFFNCNKREENCVQVLLSEHMKLRPDSYQLCLEFLVDNIHIDLTYKYEESLLLAIYPPTVSYIEEKLMKIGVNMTKQQAESMNRIVRRRAKRPDDILEGSTDFNIHDMIEKTDKSEHSIISAIDSQEFGTSF